MRIRTTSTFIIDVLHRITCVSFAHVCLTQYRVLPTAQATNGMLWRVNGGAVVSRGANMIPMEELEGRMSGIAHRQLVKSAADGSFNTLRVWGGGMFLPDAFYDAADEYEHPPLFVNSDVIVNIMRLHTRIPLSGTTSIIITSGAWG